MTTIIFIFILSFAFSLILTPQVKNIAFRFKLVDLPSERKVHSQPIPRIGGIALFLSFFLPFASVLVYSTQTLDLLKPDAQTIHLIVGASLAFGLGLTDDLRSLGPKSKFAIQIISALIAYMGGIRISVIYLPMIQDWYLGMLSLPVTVLWFVLVINSINLIDGLDGLAAGVTLFASLVLLLLCVTSGKLLVAMGLAALGGSTLGFLRYNFNPASIFMGDSGSYFLGYMLAALSIMGSIKSQATVAMLIPVIALGVPLIDTIWATLRRFILGQRLFHPDKGHFHHRLLKYGFTHRKAVLCLYGVTILLGMASVFLVNARDDRAALILLLLGAVVFIGIRKLGYLEYVAMDKIYGWFKDVTDEVGITHERRSFLNFQVEISQSWDVKELWSNICRALDKLGFDMAEMHLENMIELRDEKMQEKLIWHREGSKDSCEDICKEYLLKLELPLVDGDNKSYGMIWLVKDLSRNAITQYTLRRVEHLRRTIVSTLKKLMGELESFISELSKFSKRWGVEMEELFQLRSSIEQGRYDEALTLIGEMEEMSRDNKISKIENLLDILLLHLIKKYAERRTTRFWEGTIKNVVDMIRRTNKRRKTGGYYLSKNDLQKAIEDSWNIAMRKASFDGGYDEVELTGNIDKAKIKNDALKLVLQG